MTSHNNLPKFINAEAPEAFPTSDRIPGIKASIEADPHSPVLRLPSWGVYCFQGVGGDWLSITPEALDELTGYLERHSEIWTGTFGDILRYIQERKAASIEIKQIDSSSLALAVHWPMNKQIYDVPLTLKVE